MLIGAALVRVRRTPGRRRQHRRALALAPRRRRRRRTAIRTRQFWFLWVVLFCNVTAGIGILEQAAPMIQDFFREGGDSSISAAAAGGFVGVLSLANMIGRFVWSSLSDRIGRKPTYVMYLGGRDSCSTSCSRCSAAPAPGLRRPGRRDHLRHGGGFATVPAYLKDLFGTLEVGAIHGRLLTAWAAAGVAGPLIVNGILDRVGETGQPGRRRLPPRLLTMVGVLAVGFLANLMIRPVAEAHFDHDATRPTRTASRPGRRPSDEHRSHHPRQHGPAPHWWPSPGSWSGSPWPTASGRRW